MAEANDEISKEPAVVTVGEAAERLGKSVDSVRSLIRRGRLTARRGNSGQLLVTLHPDAAVGTAVTGESGDSRDEALAVMRDEAEHWRREAEEARVRAARAEGEASAQRELVAELKGLLEEARRPFWRRWIG